MNELLHAIEEYLATIAPKVAKLKQNSFTAAVQEGVFTEQLLFERCEKTESWQKLYAIAKATADPEVFKGLGFHEGLLGNWFRRRVYLKCLREDSLDPAQLATDLVHDSQVTAADHEVIVLADVLQL